jgi:hypothetical protein
VLWNTSTNLLRKEVESKTATTTAGILRIPEQQVRGEAIQIILEDNEQASTSFIRDSLSVDYGIVVSKSTVLLDLHASGLSCFPRPFGPHVTSEEWEKKRVEFANSAHVPHPAGGLHRLHRRKLFLCSDCRRKQRARDKKDVKPRDNERWTASVHCFGLFGLWCKRIFQLPQPGTHSGKRGGANADEFTETLIKQRDMLQELHGRTILLDGAKIHTAKHYVEFLEAEGVKILADWPDLNEIKNCLR